MYRFWLIVVVFAFAIGGCLPASDSGGGNGGGSDAGGDGSFDTSEDTASGDTGGQPDNTNNPTVDTLPGGACNCDVDCAAVDGHMGFCVYGICFTQATGNACSAGGSRSECAAGSRCWDGICWPDCASYSCDGACDDDGSCAPTTATSCDPACGSFCEVEDVGGPCSPEQPNGDCPGDQVCRGGECVDFECDDTVMEPNETWTAAREISGAVDDLMICSGDRDWFQFAPTGEDVLHLLGVQSNYNTGNLDVALTDGDSELQTVSENGPDLYHEEGTVGPLLFEGYSMVGAPGAADHYLEVTGVSGAVNDYDLVWDQIPYVDGPDCRAAGYSAVECTAWSGGLQVNQLIMFPVSHADDPYIGDGVMFQTGFSQPGWPHYQPSSHLWARRDLVMAIRYAIHVVQEEFPGTTPLGVGDISTNHGETPDGHPFGTHPYGLAIDLAYYIKPENHRTYGNMAYRVICDDRDNLRDWAAVDTDGSTGNYGECVPGSEDTHIVDIPRTARLLAAVNEAVSVRVYGVDTAVDDELDAELARLAGEGVAGASAARQTMASADIHSSWVWHFNHIHIALD